MSKPDNNTEVAVWDTFVYKADGSVMHFDILVPTHVNDKQKIFRYGKDYVKSKGETSAAIDTSHCQFCHVESPGAEVEHAISKQGHYILEMEDIPRELPMDPTRRDMVLYLKAHFEKYRFANFSGVGSEELRHLLQVEQQTRNGTSK